MIPLSVYDEATKAYREINAPGSSDGAIILVIAMVGVCIFGIVVAANFAVYAVQTIGGRL